MIDIVKQIEAVHREVGTARTAAGEGRAVRLRRTFDAPIEEVWDAVTNPERISRWFLPVRGDFRLGGRYQLEGNAGGQIMACDRPNRLLVTWVYGDTGNPADVSEVEVRLSSESAGRTVLELEHTAVVPAEMWAQFGPGAVGVGWDGGLLGLSLHLDGAEAAIEDRAAWPLTEEGREFHRLSSEAWGVANIAAGADNALAAEAVNNTTEFYTVDPNAAT